MEQKMEEKKAKQEEQVNPGGASSSKSGGGGGDLMSDLASKLAMRRKGISGNQAGDNLKKNHYIYLILLLFFRENKFLKNHFHEKFLEIKQVAAVVQLWIKFQ